MATEVDWDLHAVVRAFTITTSSSSSSSTAVVSSNFGGCYQPPAAASCGFSMFGSENVSGILGVSDAFEERSSTEELNEICKPFFSKSRSPSLQASPLSSCSSSSFSFFSAVKTDQAQQKQHQLPNKSSHAGSVATPRSKRRKNQVRKVCQVPAEAVSSDIWAWRKYGQKPIKGSPYPRGYYRCSSSKGCLARKQVERNRSDPTMFIVTYTAEHNHPAPTHRSSLAGSTRQKPLAPQAATSGGSDQALAKSISPATSGAEEEVAAQSSKSESKEEVEDLMDDAEEDGFGLLDTVLKDDFFEGLDELTRPSMAAVEDCFSDPFSASLAPLAWVVNSAAAAAGGG